MKNREIKSNKFIGFVLFYLYIIEKNNMFNRKVTEKLPINTRKHRIPSILPGKDENSSAQNPFKKQKKKEERNLLFEFNSNKAYTVDKKSIWELILKYFMAVIGKRKEWEETKSKLQQMQTRISNIESLLNTSTSNKYKIEGSYKV